MWAREVRVPGLRLSFRALGSGVLLAEPHYMRIVVLASLAAMGCGMSTMDGPSSPPGDDDMGTPENPIPTRTGPYHVTNTIDFTVDAILPPDAALIVKTLHELETDPAHALITVAEAAGIPAIGLLYDALPGVLKDKLESFIADELMKIQIGGRPITEYAGMIADLADTALTQFAVDSELAISADMTTATHRLTALDLAPAGLDVQLPIRGLAGDVLTQTPSIFVAEAGALSIGEQHFGLNYGEYAWQLIELASTKQFGAGVRQTIGNAVNCPKLAHAVASKCVLGVCVGHETELTQICEGGLDSIVDLAHQQIAKLRLEAFHLKAGTARLVSDDGDGVGDRVVDGVWQAEINLGAGLRDAPATFDGVR